MKKGKWFGLIEIDVPENEWEAKYLRNTTKDLLAYFFGAMLILLFTLFGVIYFASQSCELQLSGKFNGNLELNTENLNDQNMLKQIKISELKGEAKILGPCYILPAIFNFDK